MILKCDYTFDKREIIQINNEHRLPSIQTGDVYVIIIIVSSTTYNDSAH